MLTRQPFRKGGLGVRQRTRTVWSMLLILALLLSLAPAAFAEETELPEEQTLEEPAAVQPAEESAPPVAVSEPEPEGTSAETKKAEEEEEDLLDLDEEKLSEEELAICLWIEDFLRVKMELNDAAIAAILSSIHRESRFDATLVGDNGAAVGLFQWHGVRRDRLIEYCRKHRLDYMSVRGQMFFFRYEMHEYFGDLEKHILRKCIDSKKGALWVSGYFCEGFEAPSEMEQNLRERAELTRRVYYELVKTGEWPEEDPDEVAAKAAKKAAAEAAKKAAAEAVEQPVKENVEQPVEEAVERPVEEAVERPVEETVEQPAEEAA